MGGEGRESQKDDSKGGQQREMAVGDGIKRQQGGTAQGDDGAR